MILIPTLIYPASKKVPLSSEMTKLLLQLIDGRYPMTEIGFTMKTELEDLGQMLMMFITNVLLILRSLSMMVSRI